jgi:acyl-CoA synthetase (AMP-forming)/AMP-acid ligase II
MAATHETTHTSLFPAVDIPDQPLSEFVLGRARELGDKAGLVDGPSGRTITYAQLAGGVDRVAAGLARRGLAKGQVVGLFSPNIPEFALAFYGITSAGGVVTTINSLAIETEVATQLRAADARFLMTVPPFLDRAVPAAEAAGVEDVFVIGDAEGGTPFASLLAGDGPRPEPDIDPARDLVVLPYSSGTTGLSKGVMLTHRNLVANVLQTFAAQRVAEDDRIIAVLPFFHIYGMEVALNLSLWRGATIVTMPRFELEPFLQIMQDQAITRAYLVPPIVLALAKHPAVDAYDLSSLRIILCGAAPLGPDLEQACAERLGCPVMQGYGLTEASPVTHATLDDPSRVRRGTIGQLLPNTECRVVDVESGEDLPPGQDGELWVRGPQVMRGYLNDPEATASTITAEGWLRTGDIGHVDADGYYTIVDRLKELIKYKGYQVPPAELEAVLTSHPAVGDAAVIGVPDEEAGELPKAFVVLSAPASEEDIMAYVAERVSPYKRIRFVEVVEEIPRSLSGKILRRLLKERDRTGGQVG